MKSLWDEKTAQLYKNDPLAMRVYTSRLLGASQDLVLHGGGNTSVKIDDLLYVKGSGWDLSSIEKEGFPAVDLNVLKEMAARKQLSDSQMVKEQRAAMVDKSAPNPSIEAILHAVIPFKFVDHTHTDAVVTITNTPNGKENIRDIYGENMLIIDYVMPGFVLAKEIYEKTKDINWAILDGIILLNHGVFTFDDDAKKSYEKMIEIVSKAEQFLEEKASLKPKEVEKLAIEEIDAIKKEIEKLRGCPVTIEILDDTFALSFSSLDNLSDIVHNGPLTPEHVIRIKPFPLVIENDFKNDIKMFIKQYQEYFNRYAQDEIMLDLAPRYAIYKNRGIIIFGKDKKETKVIKDIVTHTFYAMLKAEKLGGWKSLDKKDIFDMEYWELEQAKLRKK